MINSLSPFSLQSTRVPLPAMRLVAYRGKHDDNFQGNEKATLLAEALNKAVGRILTNRKSPSRRVNEIDNRATNFYVALYWAEYLAETDPAFRPIFEQLSSNRSQIVDEFKSSQNVSVDLGGYYLFDHDKTKKAMLPSSTLNAIVDSA